MSLILLAITAIVVVCIAAFYFAIYALPFMALCGRPHKSIYVASGDMWRTGDRTLFSNTAHAKRATY